MKHPLPPILLLVTAVVLSTGEAISCDTVQGNIAPCLGYLTGGNGQPSDSCCAGVKGLAGSLRSRQDKEAACYCLKSAASRFNVRGDAAAKLAGTCGVGDLGIPVSSNVDCSRLY